MKEVNFDAFSSKFDIKTLRKIDQIRAKMRPTIGAILAKIENNLAQLRDYGLEKWLIIQT